MSQFSYSLSEAWRSLWSHRGLTFNSLLALIGALVVPGVFLILLVNTLHSIQTLGDRREMVVFLLDEAPDSTVMALTDSLSQTVRTVTYVSKEEAWDEMARELGSSSLLEAVGENPLPASLRLRLRPRYLNHASMDSIAGALRAHDAVEGVRFGSAAVEVMDQLLATLRWVGIAVGTIIGLVVLFVVANTIRITIVARSEIYRTMRQLGAGRRFVYIPLILEGMLASLLASLVALAIVFLLYVIAGPQLVFLPQFLPTTWMLGFVGASVLLGGFGSLLALGRVGGGEAS